MLILLSAKLRLSESNTFKAKTQSTVVNFMAQYTSVLTNFAVNYSDVSVAFLYLFVLHLQGGTPSYGVKFCKSL